MFSSAKSETQTEGASEKMPWNGRDNDQQQSSCDQWRIEFYFGFVSSIVLSIEFLNQLNLTLIMFETILP